MLCREIIPRPGAARASADAAGEGEAGGALAGMRPSHIYATSTDLVALRHDLQDFETRYGEIDLPVGILFGDKDRVLNYRRHGLSMLDKIADLDLEIAEGVGHMPQYAVTGQVVAFIRRIAERAFHPIAVANAAR